MHINYLNKTHYGFIYHYNAWHLVSKIYTREAASIIKECDFLINASDHIYWDILLIFEYY